MAKRDPNKTARNRLIQAMKIKLRDLLPEVLRDSGINGEASLNAKLGSRNDDFFNLKDDVINSGDQFSSQWLHGLKISALDDGVASDLWLWNKLKAHKSLQDYTILFLKRSFLIHFDELSRNRPPVESAEIWIGQKNANYGLLVTPRFRNGKWENDKSEIRHFKKQYWSIGHILETGFVIPEKDDKITFKDVPDYLTFFVNVIVRNSGSKFFA